MVAALVRSEQPAPSLDGLIPTPSSVCVSTTPSCLSPLHMSFFLSTFICLYLRRPGAIFLPPAVFLCFPLLPSVKELVNVDDRLYSYPVIGCRVILRALSNCCCCVEARQ